MCLLNCLAAKDRGMYDTYVSACVQHNGLRAHMMGLPFKMYCNYNVEDDAYSNCIERDGIEIYLTSFV